MQGWLEDCLDEIDMREDNECLLRMCDDLLNMFEWSEYTGSDLKFRKAMALGALGRKKIGQSIVKNGFKKSRIIL